MNSRQLHFKLTSTTSRHFMTDSSRYTCTTKGCQHIYEPQSQYLISMKASFKYLPVHSITRPNSKSFTSTVNPSPPYKSPHHPAPLLPSSFSTRPKMRTFIFTVALAMAMAMVTSHAFPMAAVDGDKHAPPWFGSYNPFRDRHRPRGFKTCDEVPGMCRGAWGSPGPDCCGRLCVNLRTDFFNCGRCGRRCRFGEMCCGGGCVNVFYDPNNCGFCGNRCKPGGFCRYGMCDYAS